MHIILIVLFTLFSMASYAAENPQEVIKRTADALMKDVFELRSQIDSNPELISKLADEYTSPYFDYSAMTKSSLGRFWQLASSEQQKQLTTEFKKLLIKTYGTALLGMSDKLSIEYPSYRYASGDTRVIVPTRMQLHGGPTVPVNYRAVLNNDAWKVTDITIDGISLVTNYRSSFAREIQLGSRESKNTRDGISRLISRLKAKNNSSF